MSIRGVVREISNRPFGNVTLHSVQLEGDRTYYRAGERVPPMEVGKAYEFDVKQTGNNVNIIHSTIRPWEGGETVSAAPVNTFKTSPRFARKADDGKDEYWKNKEARDVRNDSLRELGATRNTAIAFIDLLLKQEAVKLPAAQAKKEEVIWEMLNHYTQKLLEGQTKDPSPENVKEETAVTTEDGGW